MAATSVNPTGALKLSSPVRFDTALKISRQLFHPYCLRRVLQAGLSGDSPLPQVTTGRADSCFAAHLPSRLRLSDPERFTLAEIGKRLGRKRLKHVACTANPDTILAWYRRLIARKFDGSKHRTYPGVMEGNPTSRQKSNHRTVQTITNSSSGLTRTACGSELGPKGGLYETVSKGYVPSDRTLRCSSACSTSANTTRANTTTRADTTCGNTDPKKLPP